MSDSIVQTVPDTGTTLQPVDFLIQAVASLVGGSADPAAREKALECLDRAADRLNAAGVFFFRQTEVNYTSFTTAQQTLDMPADWGWPVDPAGVYDSDGNMVQVLEWKSWDIYRQVAGAATGRPAILSLSSELDDLIYVAPKIDPNAVTRIRLTYLARIQRPSEATTLYLQPETREALITGGQALITQYRYLKFPAIWRPMMDDFDRQTRGAIAASARWLEAAHMAAVPELTGYLNRANQSFNNIRPVYIQV